MSRPTRELATRGAERDPQARRFEVRIVTIGKTPRRTLTYHATVTAENESAAAAASILDMVELERAVGRPVTPGEAFRADVDDGTKTWHMVAQFAPPGHRPARRRGRGSTYDDRAREQARDTNRQQAVERDARFAATERNGPTAGRTYLVHIVQQDQPNGPAQQIDWSGTSKPRDPRRQLGTPSSGSGSKCRDSSASRVRRPAITSTSSRSPPTARIAMPGRCASCGMRSAGPSA